MLRWHANPFWFWPLLKLARGQGPAWIASSIAAVLAVLALQPHQFALDHGALFAETPSRGAYVWAIAIALPLLAFLLSRPVFRPDTEALNVA